MGQEGVLSIPVEDVVCGVEIMLDLMSAYPQLAENAPIATYIDRTGTDGNFEVACEQHSGCAI